MAVKIINADVMDGLRQIPDESVQCVVTSPPYFGLRDYEVEGQIGREATPSDFVDRIVDVFRDVRRVLRDDGSCWVNMGDSYNNADKWGGGGANTGKHRKDGNGKVPSWEGVRRKWKGMDECKPKDLIGVPWMLAFALRADGWWLRSANVWAKPNGMPESVEDRPTVGHEYVFQLTKSSRYYYNAEAVRLPPLPQSVSRLARAMRGNLDNGDFVISGGGYAPPGQSPHQGARGRAACPPEQRGHGRRHAGFNDRWDAMERAEQQSQGSALRSVWWIAPGGFPEAHFATMPEELAAVCIQSGSKPGDTILDPFGGAGTTGLVADRLQRDAILIELNPTYADMAKQRLQKDRGGLLDMMEPSP